MFYLDIFIDICAVLHNCFTLFSWHLLVMTGRHGMDKSRDRYRDSNKRESSKNREIDGPERERRCSRSREKERECEKERGRVSDTEHLVQKMLVIGSSA